jgi:hypothetical protein
MTTLKNTPENTAIVEALKKTKEVHWTGEITHDNIDKCLTAINLYQRVNSGWYKPTAIRLKGVNGIFMINEDGRLNWESRILKVDNDTYKIENLSNEGYNNFENNYIEALA